MEAGGAGHGGGSVDGGLVEAAEQRVVVVAVDGCGRH